MSKEEIDLHPNIESFQEHFLSMSGPIRSMRYSWNRNGRELLNVSFYDGYFGSVERHNMVFRSELCTPNALVVSDQGRNAFERKLLGLLGLPEFKGYDLERDFINVPQHAEGKKFMSAYKKSLHIQSMLGE